MRKFEEYRNEINTILLYEDLQPYPLNEVKRTLQKIEKRIQNEVPTQVLRVPRCVLEAVKIYTESLHCIDLLDIISTLRKCMLKNTSGTEFPFLRIKINYR